MRIPPIPHREPKPVTPIEAARRAALKTGRISPDAVARNARRDPAKIPVMDPERVFRTPEALRAADREGPDYVRRLTEKLVHKALEGEIRFPRDDLSIYQLADRLAAELERPERVAARRAAMHKRGRRRDPPSSEPASGTGMPRRPAAAKALARQGPPHSIHRSRPRPR